MTESIDNVAALIRKIHDAPLRIVLAVTGGGSRAISELLEVPGASRTVLEATVPYHAEALIDWIHTKPEHFCSERTARAMAMTAYQRALSYVPNSSGQPVAGIACTASLASDRHKHGEHRIYVGLQLAAETRVWSVQLSKGARRRDEEEMVAAHMVLNVVAQAAGLSERLPLALRNESVLEQHQVAPIEWQQLLAGERASAFVRGEAVAPAGIFPGAFDPLHAGHRRMQSIAIQRLGGSVGYELSIENVDKPPLDFIEMQRRAGQFRKKESLWFTRAPTFVEKSVIFPATTFVVGADTLQRIADPRYYGDDPLRCREALDAIADRGCRFLVFGRRRGERFVTLVDLSLPGNLAAICDEVPASEFREDISSTELRKERNSNEPRP